MVHDVPDGPGSRSTYECLGCGLLVTAETHPDDCASCGGPFQGRGMSLE